MHGHVDPAEWADIMPQIKHVHAKFYDIDENGDEPAIDYPAIVREFVNGGYSGFFSSEWEGHAFADLDEADPVDLVRKQHDLIRRSITAALTEQGLLTCTSSPPTSNCSSPRPATDAGDRVRAAAAAGFDAVEMWFSTDKDLDSLAKALADTGVQLTSMIAGPRMGYTFPGTDLAPFHEGLDLAVEHARQLGCPRIVLASGVGFPGMNRQRNLQVIIDMFAEAVERHRGSGVEFILEPVNSRVDHPGALTDRTEDAVVVARAIGDDSFGILYDLYHSVTQGEDPATELANAAGLVKYVQIADAPGRREPGSGGLDWAAQLAVVRASGYDGPIGLEYFPTVESAKSVEHIRSVAADA